MATTTGTTVVISINSNLEVVSVLLARLGKIQHALDACENQTLSICTISSANNLDSVTRLLDPVLDEALDMVLSSAVGEGLRAEAVKYVAELATLGVILEDELVAGLIEYSPL